jgi:hypothetical protein
MCIFRMIFHYFKPSLYSLWIKHFWVGRNLYCTTHAVAWGLSFSGLIRRTAPVICILQLMRGCVGPILTRIPMVHCYGYENTQYNICIIYVYDTFIYHYIVTKLLKVYLWSVVRFCGGNPVRIRVRIDLSYPLVCRKCLTPPNVCKIRN